MSNSPTPAATAARRAVGVCPAERSCFPTHPDRPSQATRLPSRKRGSPICYNCSRQRQVPPLCPHRATWPKPSDGRAQAEQAKAAEDAQESKPAHDSLDDLVDDIDAMDL